ncbi:hypothetical protein ACE60T_005925 [Salmonella enterica]
MPVSNCSMTMPVYQSLCDLRSSIDGLYCAASLLPEGVEDESLRFMFIILAERIQGDLAAVFNSMGCLDSQIGEYQKLAAI